MLPVNLKPNQENHQDFALGFSLFFRNNRPQHALTWQSKQQSCVIICSNFKLSIIFGKLGLQYLEHFKMSLFQRLKHTHTPCWTVLWLQTHLQAAVSELMKKQQSYMLLSDTVRRSYGRSFTVIWIAVTFHRSPDTKSLSVLYVSI